MNSHIKNINSFVVIFLAFIVMSCSVSPSDKDNSAGSSPLDGNIQKIPEGTGGDGGASGGGNTSGDGGIDGGIDAAAF